MAMLLDAVKLEIMKTINCAKVGVIQEFNPDNQTATVQIAFTQVTSISTQNVRTVADYPLLLNVPVQFPAGGGCTLTFPVQPGDECLVVFNDRQIDNWLEAGAGQPPNIGRVHDLSDGLAILGFRSNPRALASFSTTTTQLRTDTGTTFVEIDPDAEAVRLHGGTVYEWDCHGYGEKWTWLGGNHYRHDTYFIGADVTTVAHDFQPPGPPS